MTATIRRFLLTALLAGILGAAYAPSAYAAFGLNGVSVSFSSDAAESVQTVAGSHPYALTTAFRVNTKLNPGLEEVPDGEIRTFNLNLPAGIVGNPTATPQCLGVDFVTLNTSGIPNCADDTAVGLAGSIVTHQDNKYVWKPLYNLVPSHGEAAKLGFYLLNVPVTVDVGVKQDSPYNVTASSINIPQTTPVFGAKVVTWGNPEDPSHNPLRGTCMSDELLPVRTAENASELAPLGNCGTDAPESAFLTLPRSCNGSVRFVATAESWLTSEQSEVKGETPGFTNCGELSFDPTIAAGGSNSSGESPSGLDFHLEFHDPGLTDPGQRAQSDLKETVVTLPEGFTTNPSVANGLTACTLDEYRLEGGEFGSGPGCPESSDIGTVEVTTPLLKEKLTGQIYVAKQRENPFNSLIALYMIIRNENLGILVKQALKVEPDPVTGRLTSTVTDIPQLPFSDFRLHFRDGSRAPLITPATCGRYDVQADLIPAAEGVAPLHRTASLQVSSGAEGGHCASSPSQLPNVPSFSAGTVSPRAGAYSPFVLRLSRSDGSQQFSSISTTLPKGLVGRIAEIPYCPDTGLAQAASRTQESQGALEISSPSCPKSSEVGTVTAASGAGPDPLYVSGHAYLAGPYKGAPFSLEIITPAIAGPFDLGVVAIRTALQVNLKSAEITAVSDPIPTILHGLPLDVRSIAINMSRPDFTLNPTSCEPKSITGSATSTLGSIAQLSQYFQASGCGGLNFGPKLSLKLRGKTRRAGHPSLRAVVTYPKGSYANIARAQVGLPHSEFLDQGNIREVCTQPKLLSNTCPKKSIYGRAKAWTPLLAQPLEGPVYLGVGYGHTLPDLVADLQGQIRILLNGKVDQTKQKGLRNTFEAVPDAPVSKFILELKGGPKYGLIENSENICRRKQKASVKLTAQNGKVLQFAQPIANECKKAKKGTGKKRKKAHGGGKSRH
jgi:hypothetical protein